MMAHVEGEGLELAIDPKYKVICIDDMRFSREIFNCFNDNAEAGTLFRFIKKEEGYVTIGTVARETVEIEKKAFCYAFNAGRLKDWGRGEAWDNYKKEK